jgi:tRNA A-37 threonylcarbamoyl transferase component Bud32
VSGKPPLLTIAEVRSFGRGAIEAFRIRLNDDSGSEELLCQEVVRIIPGNRLVCFAEWNGLPVVAKFFLRSQRAIRQCRREVSGSVAFQRARVPTPRILFQGWVGNKNCPVLLQERVTNSESLKTAWDNCSTDEQRASLLKLAVQMVAKHHAFGLKQADLHLGNFLLQNGVLFSIDGGAVQVNSSGGPIVIHQGLENVALLIAQLPLLSDEFVAQVYQSYLAARDISDKPETFGLFERSIQLHRKKRLRLILRKTNRECTEFKKFINGRWKSICGRKFDSADVQRILADPDAAISRGTRLVGNNEFTNTLINTEERPLEIKRYNLNGLRSVWQLLFRTNPALHDWYRAHTEKALGRPTTEPIAIVEKQFGLFTTAAYFISEYKSDRCSEGKMPRGLDQTVRHGALNLRYRLDCPIELASSRMLELLEHSDAPDASQVEILKTGRRRSVFSVTVGNRSVLVKSFPFQKINESLRWKRYAPTEVANNFRAARRGISTPECYGLFVKKRFGLVKNCGVVMENLMGWSELQELADRDQSELFRAIPVLIELYNAGVNHIDVSPTNLMFDSDGERYCIIDWQYCSFHEARNDMQLVLQGAHFLKYANLEVGTSFWLEWITELHRQSETSLPLQEFQRAIEGVQPVRIPIMNRLQLDPWEAHDAVTHLRAA